MILMGSACSGNSSGNSIRPPVADNKPSAFRCDRRQLKLTSVRSRVGSGRVNAASSRTRPYALLCFFLLHFLLIPLLLAPLVAVLLRTDYAGGFVSGAETASANRQVFIPGDIILGGLFPIHEGGRNGSQCGRIKADQGVQRMVAMLYALETINRNGGLLPGIRLGARILDTCSIETHALEQSLEFIKTVMSSPAARAVSLTTTADDSATATTEALESLDTLADRRLPACADGLAPSMGAFRRQPVAAVVGAASSQVSVMVASMLQLFKIPMLSYSSTGVELSEKPRFAYFSRVVPPDNLQAKAMAHLVAQLEWNYVHAIADTGSYGERGMDSFRAAATERGICIDGDIHKISRRWTDDQFEELLVRMRHSNKARGVVMFVDEDNLRRFLTILKRMIRSGSYPQLRNYFWFVASDSWGMKTSVIKGFEQIARGAITIAPKVRFLKGFNEYFERLGPINTFLSEYWQSMNCTHRINENFQRCFDSIGFKFKQELYVPFVYDAVKLVAQALHAYIRAFCGDVKWTDCQLSQIGFEGYRLQQYYRNVSLSEGQPPLIDPNGDGIGQYSIFQLGEHGTYKKVGRWLAGNRLDLDTVEIRRGLQRIDGSATVPVSVCSAPCRLGFYRAYQDQTCCWTCIPCDITTSIIVNETSCVQCELGMIPNDALDACQPIEPVHLEWLSAWAIGPAVLAFCGLTATLFVVAIFVKNNNTPVVMASSRELCYCMLTGIALCYLVTFVLVGRPNPYMCALSRLLIGASMAAIYAAILVKTNRVARVFKPSSAIRPRFISPSSQVAICASIVSVQLIGSSVWLIVDPPGITIQYPTRIEAVLTCKATASHLLVSLMFNMFLILACTIYAFKTRKIPENFNETRLIGFTMYSTCILWLAFGPIYFATQNNFKIQITSLCVCISLSGTVALACIFAPKVYIVLCQPYKNVRTRSSAVGKLVNQQMRFISQISSTSPSCGSAAITATLITANNSTTVAAGGGMTNNSSGGATTSSPPPLQISPPLSCVHQSAQHYYQCHNHQYHHQQQHQGGFPQDGKMATTASSSTDSAYVTMAASNNNSSGANGGGGGVAVVGVMTTSNHRSPTVAVANASSSSPLQQQQPLNDGATTPSMVSSEPTNIVDSEVNNSKRVAETKKKSSSGIDVDALQRSVHRFSVSLAGRGCSSDSPPVTRKVTRTRSRRSGIDEPDYFPPRLSQASIQSLTRKSTRAAPLTPDRELIDAAEEDDAFKYGGSGARGVSSALTARLRALNKRRKTLADVLSTIFGVNGDFVYYEEDYGDGKREIYETPTELLVKKSQPFMAGVTVRQRQMGCAARNCRRRREHDADARAEEVGKKSKATMGKSPTVVFGGDGCAATAAIYSSTCCCHCSSNPAITTCVADGEAAINNGSQTSTIIGHGGGGRAKSAAGMMMMMMPETELNKIPDTGGPPRYSDDKSGSSGGDAIASNNGNRWYYTKKRQGAAAAVKMKAVKPPTIRLPSTKSSEDALSSNKNGGDNASTISAPLYVQMRNIESPASPLSPATTTAAPTAATRSASLPSDESVPSSTQLLFNDVPLESAKDGCQTNEFQEKKENGDIGRNIVEPTATAVDDARKVDGNDDDDVIKDNGFFGADIAPIDDESDDGGGDNSWREKEKQQQLFGQNNNNNNTAANNNSSSIQLIFKDLSGDSLVTFL